MNKPYSRAGAWIALAGVALLGLGCSQGQQAAAPQAHSVRAAVETAPADLQLLCAAEAAKVYSTPAEKILPVSSARSGQSSYDVELDVAGRRARCTIDESGTLVTVVDA
ncbi:hypothetical protein [Microbaculum sp. FT89]|uniref:hypothetical protein n=1 Tax=Microbaculum sp. FT89 TaxID=3447298 RepID=UPI003F53900D